VIALLAILTVGATWFAYQRASPPAPATPYNVLLISLDTVRQDSLGSHGRHPRHAADLSPSPALDRLASEGVSMIDAYASSSWTLPSHISMLTGETPLVHAVETEANSLDGSIPTMAEILSRHGYRTYGFYTAPYVGPQWGFARGFDAYDAVYPASVAAAARRSVAIRNEVERVAAERNWRGYDELKREEVAINRVLNENSEVAITSDQIGDAVVSRLRTLAREDGPWFVFAHFFDAHCDYVPPPPFDTRFDPNYVGSVTGRGCLAGPEIGYQDPDRLDRLVRTIGERDLEHVVALYEGEVAWVDSHVERILLALDELGLADDTLVIVTSDHGEEFFEHGGIGHRHTLYEEVARVPLLLRLPGVLPAGARIAGAVAVSDILPTVLELIGSKEEVGSGSSSLVGLIRGSTEAQQRSAMSRVVMMFGGTVQVDGTREVLLRQIVVQDVFVQGAIKISRKRSWPQFDARVEPSLQPVLAAEAAAQFRREDLAWIDLARHPGEAEDQYSRDFSDARARAVLDAFRREYRESLTKRKSRRASPLPQNARDALERLGYSDSDVGAAFPEPDVVLPLPGES